MKSCVDINNIACFVKFCHVIQLTKLSISSGLVNWCLQIVVGYSALRIVRGGEDV